MSRKCIGCGATLQTKDKEKQGYIIKEKYDSAQYCERCFKIIHYNEKLIMPLSGINDYIIKEVNNNKIFSFFLIDFLNINKETINTYHQIKNKKILVISKLDIIPKDIKITKITSWLKKEYKVKEDILFISTKKNKNTFLLYKILEKEQENKAYILGYTNAGKSTLINKLCMENNIMDNIITTSVIPNTTLDFIHIVLDKNLQIIDSPGFTLVENIYQDNEFDLIEKMNPKNFLKPTTYQVKSTSSILIENKIRIQSSVPNSLTFYMSNSITLDRVFDTNTELLENHKQTYHILDNQDIVIKGLGFINIKKACSLTIYINNENLIEIRNAMF